MNGFELIEYIRGDRRYARVPIVVVSADTDPETPQRSFRLGASAYFSKPCSPVAVRKTLEQLLHANQALP
jgi:CheY-like chemotaxis protein